MRNLLSANFYRLARCKLFYVLLAAQAILEVMLVQSDQGNLRLTNAGPDSSMFAYPTWSFLMVSALCGLFSGSGYSSGTFRNQMICGRSRFQIYLANWVTALFIALCLGLTAEVVGAVYGLAAWGPFQLEGWDLPGTFWGRWAPWWRRLPWRRRSPWPSPTGRRPLWPACWCLWPCCLWGTPSPP